MDFVIYENDMQVKLMSSMFLNLVSEKFNERVQAFKNGVDYPLKLIYLSGHDTTIVGFMKSILANDEVYLFLPPYASQILIELFFENDNFWVTWEYNGVRVDMRNS